MSYLVLARKYRPQTLTELVGQEHIARALSNAIRMNRVAHAYLFCGARGTGKTSTARIVAKMLNCESGPTIEPCGTCVACTEIAAGNCIDVYELDAASNRGVNEIRELREGVGYTPARDRHKIYIVDEAHMLTNEAANAFLKTLEEPPDHAIFILATTDPQRLPVTIRSRCQRYDFRRVRSSEVVIALRAIVSAEKVQLEDDALYLIAREGDGSMRDSLSVLDQVIAFGGDAPSAEEVAALLGVADRNRTASLLKALLDRDALRALKAIGAAHGHGIDLRTFTRSIAMEARDVLVVRLSDQASKELVDRSETELDALKKIAYGIDTAELERLANVLLEVAEAVMQARHPRLLLEMTAVRLCKTQRLADVATLVERVENLLRYARKTGGTSTPARPESRRSTSASAARPGSALNLPPRNRVRTGSGHSRQRSSDDSAEESSEGGDIVESSDVKSLPTDHEVRGTSGSSGELAAPPITPSALPAPPSTAEPLDSARLQPEPGGAAVTSTGATGPTTETEPAQAPGASPPSPPATPLKPRGRTLTDADLVQWITSVDASSVTNLLRNAVVTSSGPGRVELGYRSSVYANHAAEAHYVELMEKAAERAFGGRYVVGNAGVDPRAQDDCIAMRERKERNRQRSENEEMLLMNSDVIRVMRIFGAEAVEIDSGALN